MESALIFLLVLSVLVGFGLRGRISRRWAKYLTVFSLIGIALGAGGYLILTEFLLGTPVTNRQLLSLIFLLVFFISLWVLPTGIIGLTGAKKPDRILLDNAD
jgi:hypothetical protein